MLKRLNEIEKMDDTDKGHILSVIDGFIKSIKLKNIRAIMKIFVFGNGNLTFDDFVMLYIEPLNTILEKENPTFLLCDFKGVDTLMMEFLKCRTSKVIIHHIGEHPRYCPDKYKTKVADWQFIGGFISDNERDKAAINSCTHFLAYDFNSDEERKSGTLKNIRNCIAQNKIDIKSIL